MMQHNTPIQPTHDNINAFLHYGWLPRLDIEPPIPFDWIPSASSNPNPSIKEGGDLLKSAVEQSLGKNRDVVVPLSGGLDSRAMLAACKELGCKVQTVTLGVPGTYDFEIGQLVAKKVGVANDAINVNDIPLSTEDLVKFARLTGDWVNIVETAYNLFVTEKYRGYPIISGFLGDFIAGSYSLLQADSWETAKNSFALDNSVSRRIILTEAEYNPQDSLPRTRLLPQNSGLTHYEELVLRTRHTCSLRPTAFSHDFGYLIPFLNKSWIEYQVGAPKNLRHRATLYKKILQQSWPDFFNLPCTNHKGLPIAYSRGKFRTKALISRGRKAFELLFPRLASGVIGINPMYNYTNFHVQLHSNTKFRSIADENLTDLMKRDSVSWLNIQNIYHNYVKTDRMSTYEESLGILALVNLEINLKTTDA